MSDDSIFKVQTHESVICDLCNFSVDTISSTNTLTSNVEDTINRQTIKYLLDKYMQREHLDKYECDSCHIKNNCFKTTTVTEFKEIIIIQLSLFKFNMALGISQKIRPTIHIDERTFPFMENH